MDQLQTLISADPRSSRSVSGLTFAEDSPQGDPDGSSGASAVT
jgi:hypothetical protein